MGFITVITIPLFNAANILVEQQIDVKIEAIHFMDGWMGTLEHERHKDNGHCYEEEIQSMHDLGQSRGRCGKNTLEWDMGSDRVPTFTTKVT